MRFAPQLFQGVKRPPRARQTPKFKPPGRNHTKTTGHLAERRRRKPIMRSNERLRSRPARLSQAGAAVGNPARDFAGRFPAELETIMMTTMLENMIARIVVEIAHQRRVAGYRQAVGFPFRVAPQEPFAQPVWRG